MIIRGDKTYTINSNSPSINWTQEKDIYIIDETTERGQQLKRLYMENYPFVEFEHDGTYVTKVTVLEDEKLAEEKRLEQERLEQEMLDSLLPSERDLLIAEIELNILNILLEAELI